MKQLIRRLSRVADSSTQYFALKPDSSFSGSEAGRRRRGNGTRGPSSGVREGHLPVYVGEEMERFVVSTRFLSHPVFVELLRRSAQEYGYEQEGVLRIPCRVPVFERVLEALKNGDGDLHDLICLFPDEFV